MTTVTAAHPGFSSAHVLLRWALQMGVWALRRSGGLGFRVGHLRGQGFYVGLGLGIYEVKGVTWVWGWAFMRSRTLRFWGFGVGH